MNQDGCETFVSDCHVRTAVELINHTWDPVVISALRMGPTRRSVLLDRIAGASDKVLTESLRRLTDRGLVTRTSDARRDAARYELTALGASFANGPLAQLAEWAAENQIELSEAHLTPPRTKPLGRRSARPPGGASFGSEARSRPCGCSIEVKI